MKREKPTSWRPTPSNQSTAAIRERTASE